MPLTKPLFAGVAASTAPFCLPARRMPTFLSPTVRCSIGTREQSFSAVKFSTLDNSVLDRSPQNDTRAILIVRLIIVAIASHIPVRESITS